MPMVARVPSGRGGIRPSLLLGTLLSTEPQMPQFPGAPGSPHGSQAHRPWLCHPLRAHAPPLLGIGRTVVPCPQTLPALGTWASLARGAGSGSQLHPGQVPLSQGQRDVEEQTPGHAGSPSPLTRGPGPPRPHAPALMSGRCPTVMSATWGAICWTHILNGETEAGARMSGPLVRTQCGCLQAGSPGCTCSWHR